LSCYRKGLLRVVRGNPVFINLVAVRSEHHAFKFAESLFELLPQMIFYVFLFDEAVVYAVENIFLYLPV